MLFQEWPTIAEIKAVFSEEIGVVGGVVSDLFEDASRLLARSVLPQVREVLPADRMQGGVALKASGQRVRVHPYVFRLVCRNGAIMAQALQTRQIDFEDFATPEEALEAIREAIQVCSTEEAFTTAAEQIRTARESEIDLALNLLAFLSSHAGTASSQVVEAIVTRFFDEEERSRFALMNAVTSAARDTADPELRWRLEEFGGGIAAAIVPVPQPDDTTAAAMIA